MGKTIIVGGFGTGISQAVAERFGAAGFALALVARGEDKLAAGVKALGAKGFKATAFPADLGDPGAVRAVVGRVRSTMGSIDVLHWNAYSGAAGDLLAADAAAVHEALDIATISLLTAVREALPDLRKSKDSAVLITNGGLAYVDPKVEAMAIEWKAMGIALANAAKHKLAALLACKLKPEGVYVGEVVVLQTVKGTAFDSGSSTLEASTVASAFWDMYTGRKEISVNVG